MRIECIIISILQIGNYNQAMEYDQQERLKQNYEQFGPWPDKSFDETCIIKTQLDQINEKYIESINVIKKSLHQQPSDLQSYRVGMEYSDEQFNEIIVNLQFKKNELFKADPKNLWRIIEYIQNMPINQKSFEVVEYLIKEFGIAILYCFQPFYKRIINNPETQKTYEPQLQRISSLALYMINFSKYGELKFFSIAGSAKKGFKLKQKTPQELQFIQDIDFIRSCLILKKENPKLEALPKDRLQKLVQIRQKVKNKKLNPFMIFYINRMMGNVNKQFKFEKIEGSTAEQEPETQEFKKKTTSSLTVDCATLPSLIKNQPIETNQKIIKSKKPISQIQQIPTETPEYQPTSKTPTQPKNIKNQAQQLLKPSTEGSLKDSTIQSFDLTTQPPNIENEDEKKIQKLRREKLQMQKLQKEKKEKKLDTSKDYNINISINDFLEDTRDQTANSINFSGIKTGVNFALVPLCCRTYFFDQERILPAEDKRTEYKSYRFPFNPASIETFKKTICAFLNTIGGQIYIGIKQTTNKKYRYILGNYLSENDKEEVLKSFRKISESIYPNITRDLEVEYVPVRQSPFPQINLLNQIETYPYDFSKKEFRLENYPYKPARYVIRVRVPMGVKDEMYSYIQTEYQLNKNSYSNEFIPFRSQNEVLVKQISQEVLKKFREKLLRGNQKGWEIHKGDCKKPEIGNPRNEPEPPQEMIDAKQIEAPLANQRKREYLKGKLQSITQETREDMQSESTISGQGENSTVSKNSHSSLEVTEAQLLKIFKYPLSFIVLRMSKERLKKCIDKTPAKDYTLISLQKNELTGSDLLLIKVDAYRHMEQFLRIKEKLQHHFQKDKVEFVGVSKILKLQNFQNRRIAEQLLSKNDHKHAFNNKNLQFYSLIAAASYLLYMRQLGYRIEAMPD